MDMFATMAAKLCATPSSLIRVLQVALLCSLFCVSNASIHVVDLGRDYQSRPDKYVGLQMKAGLEYEARLQRIEGDQHLCGGGQWNVTVPDDGRPVALLVRKGLCSYAQKAEFASRNIHPPGIVKVLIIDGEMRIKDEDGDEDVVEHKWMNGYDENDDQDENSAISSYEFPIYYRDNKTMVTLRRKQADDISVVLLHVSYRTGEELLDVILNENTHVRNRGGTLVSVDGVVPPMARAVVIIWTAVCAVISMLACCCFAGFIEELLESQEPEPEPPRRARRQRLTADQIRKIPIGVFDGSQLVYDEENMAEEEGDSYRHLTTEPKSIYHQPASHSLDSCAICLDDYEIGDKLRCLPCGHAFRARCIAKWLAERSSTCPLCNINLYEEDDDEDDEEALEQQQVRNITSPTIGIEETEHATRTASLGESWWTNIIGTLLEQRRRVSGALTEPLLAQPEESHNTRSESASVHETQIIEQSNTAPANHDEDATGGSSPTSS